ncbi:hypothetical protein KK062_08940 [Fulvivirgaceae bacterium PWU5]|uniref:Lipoprotein n=1 Tax=Dawidia cretensis TaxID=2782350 RepID=A0AAP2DY65_9BACT|nr:hypothetical protein [Dawidia cretensis]MBT1708348.1 hypothetical protein [Dawidia cretensis]
MKSKILTALSLSLFAILVITACSSDDDDSQENYFTTGAQQHPVTLAARIGPVIQMQNASGSTFYRHQIKFWDDGYTYVNNVVTGEGETVDFWLNTRSEALEPNNYILQPNNAEGGWGQIAQGTWANAENMDEREALVKGGVMRIRKNNDVYTISYDLELDGRIYTKLEGYYQGKLDIIQE